MQDSPYAKVINFPIHYHCGGVEHEKELALQDLIQNGQQILKEYSTMPPHPLTPARELYSLGDFISKKYAHIVGLAQYLDYGIRTGLSSDKRAEYMEKMEASEGCNPSGSGKTDSLSAPSRIERRSSVQNMVDRILSIFGANSQKC